MNKDSRILVLGHSGLGGGAMYRKLRSEGYENIHCCSIAEGDLTDASVAKNVMASVMPQYVFLFAARVGGILANNTYPVEFLSDNMLIELNVIGAAHEIGVKKLLFIGTACAYPKFAEVPISESSMLCGEMEPTNLPYAMAKLSGVVLCDSYRREYGHDFISCMPTNLYGVGDTYDPIYSHVVPGMIMKMHKAKRDKESVVLWGSGSPRRELLYADDFSDACMVLMERYSELGPINIGAIKTVSMRQLAEEVATAVGYDGDIIWDNTKPDGTPNRQIDSHRITELGWSPKTTMRHGLACAYKDYLCRYESGS